MSLSSDDRQPKETYLRPRKGWIPTNPRVTHEALDIIDQTQPSVPDLRPPKVPKVNGLARTARVFSWLGLLAYPFAIIGLIMGYIALGRIANDDVKSRSIAKTAIRVGWIFTGLTALAFLLVAGLS
jgi:hypothetical protein